MDIAQEEMQFLGLLGIYLEAYKIIFRWRKIFTQITLTLILPLSSIFLANEEISELLYSKISNVENRLHRTQTGILKYNRLSNLVSSEWTTFMLFKATYFTFLLVFSLLSTSAVVYTVACIYTSREVTLKRVMSVVPRVWKRLMVTFLCAFLGFIACNTIFFLAIFVLIWWFATAGDSWMVGQTIFWVILMLYAIGIVYMSVVWMLASVVTVLEDSCGFKAMIKSKRLIKGKMVVAIVIFFKLNLSLAVINNVFDEYIVNGWRGGLGIVQMIGMGALCLLLLLKLILFALILQTVIYFVCKSYHHENINKSVLSDHLEVYFGDYVPLKAKDVQLEESRV